ncbi:DUF6796 family protein [Empedobacter brevis]|uniref:DUF6796 family protein n=1 Tax=Empedobacter brevis TaxID=247 RepID=UPI0039AE9CB6
MKYSTKIKWSFIAAIIASILWVIGDILIVGFNTNPADYPLLSETYAQQLDSSLAILMVEGSSQRLMLGALIASMSAFLFLPGIWLSFQFFKNKTKPYAWLTYFILIISVVLMPLGHAVFYFNGEIFKAILHTDAAAHPYLIGLAADFTKVLYITWGTAIIVLLLGWLLFSIMVFLGKTSLPRWAGFISPVFLTLYQMPIKLALPDSLLKAWISAAGFNLSYLIFFVLFFILFKKLLLQEKEEMN